MPKMPSEHAHASLASSRGSVVSNASSFRDSLSIIGDVIKAGHLKKLKTMKKKYFVIRSGSGTNPLRFEYYDSEKKYRAGVHPKRSIVFDNIFSINKKCDTKQKFALIIYTRDDSFAMAAESAVEQEAWLTTLQDVHEQARLNMENVDLGHEETTPYDYVWQANIQNKGLGSMKNLVGTFRLCLSEKFVSLIKIGSMLAEVTFPLGGIRRCGHTSSLFFMEVGRSTITGEGELWMQVDETLTAQNMHEFILSAMKAASTFRDRTDSSAARPSSRATSGTATTGDYPIRGRTVSIGQPPSPQHPRLEVGVDKTRPISMFECSSSQPVTLPAYSTGSSSLTPGSPPEQQHLGAHIDLGPHRFRSNSNDSHGSRSMSSTGMWEDGDFSPIQSFHHPLTPDSLPLPITEEVNEYVHMAPGHTSGSSSAAGSRDSSRERIGSFSSGGYRDRTSSMSNSHVDGYMEMAPGDRSPHATSTPTPVNGKTSKNGYMDMSPLATTPSSSSLPDSSYLMMGPMSRSPPSASVPIPITESTAYMDMAPGHHNDILPTVKEQGSPDGYMCMTPSRLSPHLFGSIDMKPDRVVSYLSDDSISSDPRQKRTYSVGSKPLAKPQKQGSYVELLRHGSLENASKSSSAPHLITQKVKTIPASMSSEFPISPPSTIPSPSTSLGTSFKSEDSDSFMELDFYRPRTSSESFSSRPRTSSLSKTQHNYNNSYYRPRSASHGQSSRLALKKPIFESVRTTSQELLRKGSSKESLNNSQESSKRLQLDTWVKIPAKNSANKSDYIDMSPEKVQSISFTRGMAPLSPLTASPSETARFPQHKTSGKYSTIPSSMTKSGQSEYLDMSPLSSSTRSVVTEEKRRSSAGNIHTRSRSSPVNMKFDDDSGYMEYSPANSGQSLQHNKSGVNKSTSSTSSLMSNSSKSDTSDKPVTSEPSTNEKYTTSGHVYMNMAYPLPREYNSASIQQHGPEQQQEHVQQKQQQQQHTHVQYQHQPNVTQHIMYPSLTSSSSQGPPQQQHHSAQYLPPHQQTATQQHPPSYPHLREPYPVGHQHLTQAQHLIQHQHTASQQPVSSYLLMHHSPQMPHHHHHHTHLYHHHHQGTTSPLYMYQQPVTVPHQQSHVQPTHQHPQHHPPHTPPQQHRQHTPPPPPPAHQHEHPPQPQNVSYAQQYMDNYLQMQPLAYQQQQQQQPAEMHESHHVTTVLPEIQQQHHVQANPMAYPPEPTSNMIMAPFDLAPATRMGMGGMAYVNYTPDMIQVYHTPPTPQQADAGSPLERSDGQIEPYMTFDPSLVRSYETEIAGRNNMNPNSRVNTPLISVSEASKSSTMTSVKSEIIKGNSKPGKSQLKNTEKISPQFNTKSTSLQSVSSMSSGIMSTASSMTKNKSAEILADYMDISPAEVWDLMHEDKVLTPISYGSSDSLGASSPDHGNVSKCYDGSYPHNQPPRPRSGSATKPKGSSQSGSAGSMCKGPTGNIVKQQSYHGYMNLPPVNAAVNEMSISPSVNIEKQSDVASSGSGHASTECLSEKQHKPGSQNETFCSEATNIQQLEQEKPSTPPIVSGDAGCKNSLASGNVHTTINSIVNDKQVQAPVKKPVGLSTDDTNASVSIKLKTNTDSSVSNAETSTPCENIKPAISGGVVKMADVGLNISSSSSCITTNRKKEESPYMDLGPVNLIKAGQSTRQQQPSSSSSCQQRYPVTTQQKHQSGQQQPPSLRQQQRSLQQQLPVQQRSPQQPLPSNEQQSLQQRLSAQQQDKTLSSEDTVRSMASPPFKADSISMVIKTDDSHSLDTRTKGLVSDTEITKKSDPVVSVGVKQPGKTVADTSLDFMNLKPLRKISAGRTATGESMLAGSSVNSAVSVSPRTTMTSPATLCSSHTKLSTENKQAERTTINLNEGQRKIIGEQLASLGGQNLGGLRQSPTCSPTNSQTGGAGGIGSRQLLSHSWSVAEGVAASSSASHAIESSKYRSRHFSGSEMLGTAVAAKTTQQQNLVEQCKGLQPSALSSQTASTKGNRCECSTKEKTSIRGMPKHGSSPDMELTYGRSGGIVGSLRSGDSSTGTSPKSSNVSPMHRVSVVGCPGDRHSYSEVNPVHSESISFKSNCLSDSRHSSVTSDKELNYASLDLSSSESLGSLASTALPKVKFGLVTSGSYEQEDSFNYAEIDFKKSEELQTSKPKR